MGYIARWGSMGFLVSPTKIVPFDDFSTSITLKSDNGNDTSGSATTNTRGLELQPMSFSTKYMRALGLDPRERYEAWAALVGKSYPLYIGDKRFGPAKMQLTGVSVAELLTSNTGEFISITLDLTFKEKTESSTTKTTTKTTSGASSKTTSSALAYAKALSKQKALNATPSTSDKAAKKATGRAYRGLTM